MWALRPQYWMLDADGITAIPVEDAETWGQWYRTADRRVCQDLDEGDGDKRILVSTVFLGLDHSFTPGPPVLWETMVFGGPLDGEMDRYTSHAAAVEGHQRMCQRVKANPTK